VPTIYSIAGKIASLDLNLRYWEWNHVESCHDRLIFAPDGFPVRVWRPSNRFLARLLKSGKYKDVVVKGHLTMAIGPGFPIHYTGPHMHTLARGTTRASSSRTASCSRASSRVGVRLGRQGVRRRAADHHRVEGQALVAPEAKVQPDGAALPRRVEHLISEVVVRRAQGAQHDVARLVLAPRRRHEDLGAHGRAARADEEPPLRCIWPVAGLPATHCSTVSVGYVFMNFRL